MTDQGFNNLFFALWPDREVRDELLRLQRVVSGHKGRIQHPEDLHLTLVFLGKVAPERSDCVRRVAEGVVAKPFSIELSRSGYWERPRILWCGPEQTPAPLSSLVQDLQQGLVACGFQPQRRTYKPHVTLVRKAMPDGIKASESTVVWKAREFVLAGSLSGTEQPRYRVLDRWDIPD